MDRKPDIQYVGQFYIHGSEALELAREQGKAAKTKLPLSRRRKIQKVYVDPVALIGIAVSVVMLVVMVVGAIQLSRAWTEYEQMETYLKKLHEKNTFLEHSYRSGFDLDDIAEKAVALGMIPVSEAENRQVLITMPVEEPEMTWWDEVVWFLDGLIE